MTFVNIWAGYPLYMVSLLAGLQGIPKDLYEAAGIDGANEWHKFWYITIPQLMPIIISIALLDFIWTMQVFPLVWMTTGGGPIHATEMLSTYTYKLAFREYDLSLASASAIIILLHLDEHDLLLHQASEGQVAGDGEDVPSTSPSGTDRAGLSRARGRAWCSRLSDPLDVLQLAEIEHRDLRAAAEAPARTISRSSPTARSSADPVKVRFFLNSYLVAGVVTFLTVVIAILTAYAFSRYTFRLKNPLNVFIISTQTVPPITLLIPYFGMVVAFGIFDTYFALILTYMVFTLPYAILLMTGYLNTLPKELDEAVLVDGGSSWTALWRVIVPLSLPGIVATAVYTFLLSWNEFLFALTLTKSMDMRTVPIGISLLMGQHAFEWNEMMAMSVLGSLPLLILYLIAQRYFLAGMTAGSVKS